MKIENKQELNNLKDKDGLIRVLIGTTSHLCKLDETWDIVNIMKKYSKKHAYIQDGRIVFHK